MVKSMSKVRQADNRSQFASSCGLVKIVKKGGNCFARIQELVFPGFSLRINCRQNSNNFLDTRNRRDKTCISSSWMKEKPNKRIPSGWFDCKLNFPHLRNFVVPLFFTKYRSPTSVLIQGKIDAVESSKRSRKLSHTLFEVKTYWSVHIH